MRKAQTYDQKLRDDRNDKRVAQNALNSEQTLQNRVNSFQKEAKSAADTIERLETEKLKLVADNASAADTILMLAGSRQTGSERNESQEPTMPKLNADKTPHAEGSPGDTIAERQTADYKELQTGYAKMQTDYAKLQADNAKLQAERAKLQKDLTTLLNDSLLYLQLKKFQTEIKELKANNEAFKTETLKTETLKTDNAKFQTSIERHERMEQGIESALPVMAAALEAAREKLRKGDTITKNRNLCITMLQTAAQKAEKTFKFVQDQAANAKEEAKATSDQTLDDMINKKDVEIRRLRLADEKLRNGLHERDTALVELDKKYKATKQTQAETKKGHRVVEKELEELKIKFRTADKPQSVFTHMSIYACQDPMKKHDYASMDSRTIAVMDGVSSGGAQSAKISSAYGKGLMYASKQRTSQAYTPKMEWAGKSESMQLICAATEHPVVQEALSPEHTSGGTGASTVSVAHLTPDSISITAFGDSRVTVVEVDVNTDEVCIVLLTAAHMHKSSANRNTPRQICHYVETHPANEKSTSMCENVMMHPDKKYLVIAATDGFWDNFDNDSRGNQNMMSSTLQDVVADCYARWKQDHKCISFVDTVVKRLALMLCHRKTATNYKHDDVTIIGGEVGLGFCVDGVPLPNTDSYIVDLFSNPDIDRSCRDVGECKFSTLTKTPPSFPRPADIIMDLTAADDMKSDSATERNAAKSADMQPRVATERSVAKEMQSCFAHGKRWLDAGKDDGTYYPAIKKNKLRQWCRTLNSDGTHKNPRVKCRFHESPNHTCKFAHAADETLTFIYKDNFRTPDSITQESRYSKASGGYRGSDDYCDSGGSVDYRDSGGYGGYSVYGDSGGSGVYRDSGGFGDYRDSGGFGDYRGSGGSGEYRDSADYRDYRDSADYRDYRDSGGSGDYRGSGGYGDYRGYR